MLESVPSHPSKIKESLMKESEDHPFYGYEIIRREQKEYIESLLKKYQNEPVTEELKKKIWDELQMEKYYGRVTIPFKVTTRLDSSGKFPNHIEVILDSKV
jgi:hypothetical protein